MTMQAPILGLPRETLVAITSHLAPDGEQWRDLVRATQVCSEWRTTLSTNERLWTNLKKVDDVDLREIGRVRTWATRSNGRLGAMTFVAKGELFDQPFVVGNLRFILQEVDRMGAAKRVKKIELDLSAFGSSSTSLVPYQVKALVTTFAAQKAPQLVDLRILSRLCTFSFNDTLRGRLSRVKFLHVFTTESLPMIILPPLLPLQSESEAIAEVLVEELALRGLSWTAPSFPSFPALTHLRLYSVSIPNFYGFLSKCCGTLVEVMLADVRAVSPYTHTSSRNDLPTLVFPDLSALAIYGRTPVLWEHPSETQTGFMTEMPGLDWIDFEPKWNYGGEAQGLSVGYAFVLSPAALASLLRTSPNITFLDLFKFGRTTLQLVQSLSFAPQLETLILSDFKRDFVALLPSFLPDLTELKIWAHKKRDFDLHDLRRLAEVYSSIPSRLDVWLDIVVANVQVVDADDSDVDLLARELRSSFALLSQRQVDSVIDAFVLPSDEWHRMRVETLAGPGRTHAGLMRGSEDDVVLALKQLKRWWIVKEDADTLEWFEASDWASLRFE